MLGNLVGSVVVNIKTVSLAARNPRSDTAAGLESLISDEAWFETGGALRMLVGESYSPAPSLPVEIEDGSTEEDAVMGEPPTPSEIDLPAIDTPLEPPLAPDDADVDSALTDLLEPKGVVYPLLTLLITDAASTTVDEGNGALTSLPATDAEDLDKARIAESIAEGSASSVTEAVGVAIARARV